MTMGFHRPTSLAHATELKASLGAGAFFLAGGTELNSRASRLDPLHLIDISALELDFLEKERGSLVIGATTTIQELIEAPPVPTPLRQAALNITNRNIRNQATLGGQVANNKNWGALLPALLVMGARIRGLDERGNHLEMELRDYLDEHPPALLVSIVVPLPSAGRATAVDQFTRSANDIPMVTVAASMGRRLERVHRPLLAVGGVADRVLRLEQPEALLDGGVLPEPAAIRRMIRSAISPVSDQKGGAHFKRHITCVLLTNAIYTAFSAAKDPGTEEMG